MSSPAFIMMKNVELKTPYLLIAMPQLDDPNFRHSVLLMMQHNEEGAFGLVINHKSNLVLKDLEIPDFKIHPKYLREPVWFGGPCAPDQVWLLHKTDEDAPGDVGMVATLDLISAKEKMPRLKDGDFKLVAGHAGWVAGQLEDEIQNDAWIATPLHPNLILETPPEKIWETAIRELGFDPSQIAMDLPGLLQ